MARNVTLGQLIDDVRAEAGHSLQPSLGAAMRDVIVNVLQRQQRRLWEDYDWPHLRVTRDVVAAAGQRYYNIPTDLTLERIERVEFKDGDRWHPLVYGIGAQEHNQYDSDSDIRSWPVTHWYPYDETQFEAWPIPSQDGAAAGSGLIRFTGIRNLDPLVAQGDRADLDDTLLVLFSAAEILAREKAPDASLKLQMAEKHYARLKGRASKGASISLLGGARREVSGRTEIPFVPGRYGS